MRLFLAKDTTMGTSSPKRCAVDLDRVTNAWESDRPAGGTIVSFGSGCPVYIDTPFDEFVAAWGQQPLAAVGNRRRMIRPSSISDQQGVFVPRVFYSDICLTVPVAAAFVRSFLEALIEEFSSS